MSARVIAARALCEGRAADVATPPPAHASPGYAQNIGPLTGPELSAVATKYIDSQQGVIVVVGDRRMIEPGLRALNLPVQVVDENGSPVTG